MNGQGSPPRASNLRFSILDRFLAVCAQLFWHRSLGSWLNLRSAPVLILVFSCLLGRNCNQTHGAETNLRVRIYWGGVDEKLWRGRISIPNGKFSDLRLLGIDGDQPGAYVNRGDTILISPRYESSYVGFEATVTGDLENELRLSLIHI